MTSGNNKKESTQRTEEFGRGHYLFFGFVAVFFMIAAVAVTAVVGYSVLQTDSADASPPAASATTVASADGPTGDVAAGAETFASTCSVCHGAGAVGVEGLGPSLIDNAFIQSLNNDELLVFLNEGRPPDHPDNTTGVAMPPKGGNPSLSDEDLDDVVAYLRSLN